MKKTLLLLFYFTFSISVSAQVKVQTDGHVSLGTTTPVNGAKVNTGATYTYSYPSTYSFGLLSRAVTGKYCIGIKGSTLSNVVNGSSIAVQGIAGGGQSGYCYGVVGGLNDTNQNGAGIFGTLNNHNGVLVQGRYAGYFDGNVRITGTSTIQALINPSDIRLEENIVSLADCRDESNALSCVLGMNVVKYNYKDRSKELLGDTATIEKEIEENTVKELHYGLLAQELQAIYPELVKEGQDGYLGVNYIELIPILIRSIQELKQELDESRTSQTRGTTSFSNVDDTHNVLYQNTPNPFKGKTVIRFKLAEDVYGAAIYIFDMQGKTIKEIPISSNDNSITIDGYELGPGLYLYSLVINGLEIDTKKMIISK